MNRGFSEKILHCLRGKAETHNEKHSDPVTIHQLIRVYKRGEQVTDSAWSPGITTTQAAMARVNMFLRLAAERGVTDSYTLQDRDVLTASDRTYEQETADPFWGFTEGDFIIARCDLLLAHIADSEAQTVFSPSSVEEERP